jgi:very-short-patch-repair endonuclease
MSNGTPYQEDDAGELASELFSGKVGMAEAIGKLRTRLLDLSMRNRLLNYRHPKARSIQFTNDPDLNLLFERLEEGKSVPLVYVPDPPMQRYEGSKKPDVRLYARECDIGTSVDIAPSIAPTAYKRLPGLQVLAYPADLERIARKVASEARTVIEETGTNMLYLVFGFLEYYDSEDSDKAVQAPLLSMPVTLARAALDNESRTYTYELSYSGEDIAENFTLREKLRQQFRLELPDLGEDDTPESYFSKIQEAVSKRRNWMVKRRLSLGFLSFGKLAIWADLDPTKSKALFSSELLRNIFEGGRVDSAGGFHAEDYVIDDHPEGELPLIYDADSSQHSAIIDVKNGKTLVINGPPGTGKSQTITNIIASAMADGKKVLFVSEKLAALQVVKRRLEAAGLGDFCLELHSHKTQKKQLLADIEQRMMRRFSAPPGYSKRLDVIRERRKALNAYAELLGSRIGNELELTVHEVFWATERRRTALGDEVNVASGLTMSGAQTWAAEQVDACRMVLSEASAALHELGCGPAACAWQGYFPPLLINGDELPILRVVDEALVHARKLEEHSHELESLLGPAAWTIQQIRVAAGGLAELETVPGSMNCELLGQMFNGGLGSSKLISSHATRLFSILAQLRSIRDQAAPYITRLDVSDGLAFTTLTTELGPVLSQAALARTPTELRTLTGELAAALDVLRKLAGGRNSRVPVNVKPIREGLESVCGRSELGCITGLLAPQLVAAGNAAQIVEGELRQALDQVQGVLGGTQTPFTGQVDEVQMLLDGRGLPELLPDAAIEGSSLEELRHLGSGGWGDWTAEQFAARAREVDEGIADASLAADELKAFFARLHIPVETTHTCLDAIETLLSIAESAPQELLAFRGPGLERSDFTDIAIRAEEAHKTVAFRMSKVSSAFYIDTLPDESSLRDHIKVFRRGDGFFNFLNSDWRRAKAAFQGCAREKRKLSADAMGEQFAAALLWRVALQEYAQNEQFSAALGGLFKGVNTDYATVRRLHGWIRSSTAALFASDFAHHVNANSLSENHVVLLSGAAGRIRKWVSCLRDLSSALKALPGVDPALLNTRRIDALFGPLADYSKGLQSGAMLLRRLVRPTASIQRALDLVQLRSRLSENADLLRVLVEAPLRLASVGAPIGLSASRLAYQDIRASLTALGARAQYLCELGAKIARDLGAEESPQSGCELAKALERVNAISEEFIGRGHRPGVELVQDLVKQRDKQSRSVDSFLRFLQPYAKDGVPVRQLIKAVQAALEFQEGLRQLMSDQQLAKTFGVHFRGLDTDEKAIQVCLEWSATVQRIATMLPETSADALLKCDALVTSAAAAKALEAANLSFLSYTEKLSELEAYGQFRWSAWGGEPCPGDAVERLLRAKGAAGTLIAWSKYLAAREDAERLGVLSLLLKAEERALSPTSLVAAFEYVFHRSLAKGIISAHKQLARFSGASHERLRSEFATMDRELIALTGTVYATQVDKTKKPLTGVSVGRAGDLTEMALLTKETKKQKRHVPIRQLLKRAGRSLQELKPCFMMGPLSVAQYLEPGHLKFDLVVMDEASQLRPEDALGAIARGKQLVVVGDPKQLPPTNFFDRLMDEDEEDPDNASALVDGVESILGICEHLYRPVRTLRWHYRSRHESLIAFSNSRFYDGRLVVFPSPYKQNRRLGVNFRYVAGGVYQERRNLPEAQRVVGAIIEHMLKCPEESLGVVTLNQTQRELIEDLLDKEVRNVAGVAEYLERHEKAGWSFFVKNLENVQGDERDVIFVSTTFGKPPGGGAVRQNFGPINRPDGWRRLNVLFTRARSRLDLFTSMLPTDVLVDDRVSLGRRALREYLEYAKSGTLGADTGAVTDREADSDFELAVADALRMRGYETEPQVGVAGYFIDLGVRHPTRKSEFVVGIECDGATYHSSLSARDRDRIRQEILESLGWRDRIIRVWSTDWFSDPQGQTERLVQFLERRHDLLQPTPYSDADLEPMEGDYVADAAAPGSVNASEVPPADSGHAADVFVEVGDRVTYLMLAEADEKHTIQIVDSASNPKHKLLNQETPLAQALLGLCEGDEAILKVQGQPPRPLRVLRIGRDSEGTGLEQLHRQASGLGRDA